MLTLATRPNYRTLLDGHVLRQDNPDALALAYVQTEKPDIVLTRAAFQDEVAAHAAALRYLGIQPDDLVVIAHTQNLESIFCFWGALLLGAVPSMFPTLTEKLDPAVYMQSVAELVRLSHVKAVLTTDAFAPDLRAVVSCAVYASSDLHKAAHIEMTPHAKAPQAIAFLQHSSGTTGLQKGVALSHEAVLNQLASYSDALDLREDDVIVSWLPLYHDMGLIAGFILPLVQGIPLVLMSPFDWVKHPALLLKAMHQFGGTLTWMPNFAYNHMARRIRQRDLEGIRLDRLRAFINCSEPVRADSHALFLERFHTLGVCPEHLAVSYAMAENTFAVTQTRLGEVVNIDRVDQRRLQEELLAMPVHPDDAFAAAHVSCGTPIHNTQVKVVDAHGQTLPDRYVGEIMVKSDCMLTAYYQRPDLQPFDHEGWYATGDRGYLVNGAVYVIGRSKDLIINAGKNVYPQDIEAIVNTIHGVHAGRVVAFGVPDEREGTELIAVIAEVDDDDPQLKQRISQAIRYRVAQQTDVTVTYVVLVPSGWLIKTSSGKISRSKNRDKWLAER